MSENTMLVPQMGITAEQATANCEELAKAIREITAGVLTTVNSFCRWIQQVAAEVAAQQEMETALRWASVDNPDYWLEWTTDDGHMKAFLSSSLGCPVLTITTHDAAGGQLYHEAHRLSIECLRERGMVEEVTTAMERRRQAHGRA